MQIGNFWRDIIISSFILCSVTLGQTAAEDSQKPNFLFILADDLGYADIGAFGSEIYTPNLDALAQNGIRFTNFYASPVCSPTRAMLMSGSDSHLVGLGRMEEMDPMPYQEGRDGYEGYLRSDVATLPNLLRDAGYTTLMAGKWHLGREEDQSPAARGFDRSFALTAGYGSHYGNPTFTPLPILHRTAPGPEYREDGKGLYDLPQDFYSSNFYAEKMISYLEENKGSYKPFFAYLAFTAPHWPLQAPLAYIEKYKGKYDAGYDALRIQRFNRLKALGLIKADSILPPRDRRTPAWESLPPAEQKRQARMMETYAGMVDNMDANIGRVIQYLKRTGQFDNTVIVFMSDNGADAATEGRTWLMSAINQYDNSLEAIGSKQSFVVYGAGWARASTPNLREFKGSTFDGGIRVPAIVKMPNTQNNNQVNPALLTVEDWLPTFVQLAGAKLPNGTYNGKPVAPIRGQSFAHILSGQNDTVGKAVAAWELDDDRAVRKGDWKLVYVTESYAKRLGISPGWNLYNLKDDPAEQVNLSEKEPEKLAELITEWDKYAAKNKVASPIESAR